MNKNSLYFNIETNNKEYGHEDENLINKKEKEDLTLKNFIYYGLFSDVWSGGALLYAMVFGYLLLNSGQ